MSSELSTFKPDFEPQRSCLAHIAIAFSFAAIVVSGLCLITCSGALDGKGVTITYTPMDQLTPEQRENAVILDLDMGNAPKDETQPTAEELVKAFDQFRESEKKSAE